MGFLTNLFHCNHCATLSFEIFLSTFYFQSYSESSCLILVVIFWEASIIISITFRSILTFNRYWKMCILGWDDKMTRIVAFDFNDVTNIWVRNDRYFGKLRYYIDRRPSNRCWKMCTRFNRVLAWSFIVHFSLNVIRYFAPSNIELCRHGGDRERIKLVRTVGTGSVFTRRELRTRKIGSLKFTGN